MKLTFCWLKLTNQQSFRSTAEKKTTKQSVETHLALFNTFTFRKKLLFGMMTLFTENKPPSVFLPAF